MMKLSIKKQFFAGLAVGFISGIIVSVIILSFVLVDEHQTDEDLIIQHFSRYPPCLNVYFVNITGYCTSTDVPEGFSFFYCDVVNWGIIPSENITLVNVMLKFPYFHFIHYVITDANLTFTDNNTYTNRLLLIEFLDTDPHRFYFEFQLNTPEILSILSDGVDKIKELASVW